MMIEEYTNDLTRRDLIQRVLDMVPEGSTNILQLVTEYDDHFKRLTRTGGRNTLAQVWGGRLDWWWWDRLPLSPTANMRRWELPPPATEA